MRFKLGIVARFGALSLPGYLAYAWTIEYLPTRAAGLGKLALPSYVDFLHRTNPISWFNALGTGWQLSYHGFVLLLSYLTICYLGVMRAASRQSTGVTLASIVCWTALFSLPLVFAPDMFSSDIFAYIMYGRISLVHGANPMTVPPLAFPTDPLLAYMRGWQDVAATSYGPVWLMLSHGLTFLVNLFGQTPQLYMLAYKLVAIGLHMANTTWIWRILGRGKPEQQAAGTLLYAWNPLILEEFAGSAHNDGLLVFFICLALELAQQNHWRRATVSLSLSALAKLMPVILLPLYAIFLAHQQTNWRVRAAVVGQVAGLSVLTVVLLYIPYWEGRRTVEAFLAQPSIHGTANTIGDWAVTLLPRVTKAVALQRDLSPVASDQNRPAEQPTATQERPNGPVFNLLVHRLGRLLLPPLQVMAHPWSGKVILLIVWLGTCYALWRRPSFDRLVASCFVLLLTYSLSAALWFWPWYTAWVLALAAMLNWNPAGRLMVVFTTLAWVLYFTWGHLGYLIVYAPVFALIAWYLGGVLRRKFLAPVLRTYRARR